MGVASGISDGQNAWTIQHDGYPLFVISFGPFSFVFFGSLILIFVELFEDGSQLVQRGSGTNEVSHLAADAYCPCMWAGIPIQVDKRGRDGEENNKPEYAKKKKKRKKKNILSHVKYFGKREEMRTGLWTWCSSWPHGCISLELPPSMIQCRITSSRGRQCLKI